jgi:hypothetical protein
VWEAETGQEILTLNGHSDAVWSVAFSPDGKRIVSGSHDKTVMVWELGDGNHETGRITRKKSAAETTVASSKRTPFSLVLLKLRFEARANAAITRGLSRPFLSIVDSSDILQRLGKKTRQSQTPLNRINGIDEGVGRFFTMWPAAGNFLLLQAAAKQFPGQGYEFDILPLLAGKPNVDSASKSLDRDDAADFYGKAAVQYAGWKIARQPSAQHRQEFDTMNLTANQKRQLLEDFIALRQELARWFKSDYEQIMQMGARAGLPLPK